MAILTILEYPDKRLRNKAEPVQVITETTRQQAADMLETMYDDGGLGLAATQVNIQERIVVMDLSEERNAPLFLINPEILATEGEQYEQEGCLSFPDMFDKVKRAAKVRFKALDLEGNEYTMDAEGLFAVCVQHELDHLNGILFIDHLSKLKRNRLVTKFEKSKNKIDDEIETTE